MEKNIKTDILYIAIQRKYIDMIFGPYRPDLYLSHVENIILIKVASDGDLACQNSSFASSFLAPFSFVSLFITL